MWPMVWIYQIVTGVTSVVGVPSTHLVHLEIILGMGSANERHFYIVTLALIGSDHTQNDPCLFLKKALITPTPMIDIMAADNLAPLGTRSIALKILT